jgi:D-lactate dehydrogenase (cytochrome)
VPSWLSALTSRASVSPEVTTHFGKDISYHRAADPDCVVSPRSHDEVVAVVRGCHDTNTPLIPYGSGTSLEGHTTAPRGGVTLDLSHMKRVIAVHPEDLDCVVEPGITYDELNEHLRPMGLFFPVDPGPGASIGGMVGTGCSGTHAVRYGTMRDNVLALKVVMADGSTVVTGGRARKTSAGYNLRNLFVGSEGTLGVATEVTLKLQRLPPFTSAATCTFASVEDASRTVAAITSEAIQIGRVELMDDEMVKAVNSATGLGLHEATTLILEFTGPTRAQVKETLDRVQALASQQGAKTWISADDPEERKAIWRARKEALFSASALRPGADVMVTDACVPLSCLATCLARVKESIKASGLPAPLVAHAGDGNIHLFIIFNRSDPDEFARAKALNESLLAHALALGGTITGEHGVGVGKRRALLKEHSPETMAVMRKIKQALDPKGILNPGKIFLDDKEN